MNYITQEEIDEFEQNSQDTLSWINEMAMKTWKKHIALKRFREASSETKGDK